MSRLATSASTDHDLSCRRGLRAAAALLALPALVAIGCGTADRAEVAATPDAAPIGDAGDDTSLGTGDGGAACDGTDRQGCACGPAGSTRACSRAGTPGVGACVAGVQTCTSTSEFAQWGACVGSVGPVPEICGNGIDDDCDGTADEGCADAGPDAPETCSPVCAGKCAGADDGCGGACTAGDCQGCCTSSHRCVPFGSQTSNECGATNASCTVCPTGKTCDLSTHDCVTPCTPSCAGRCAGSDDGCGGACAANDCQGCCTGARTCVPYASQTTTTCGQNGGSCDPCASYEICASTLSGITQRGCVTPPTFEGTGGLMCPSHVWTDTVCDGTGSHFDMSTCQMDRISPTCSASLNLPTGALDVQCAADVPKTGAFKSGSVSCEMDFLAIDHRLHDPKAMKRCLIAWGVWPITSAPGGDFSSTPVVTTSISSVSSSAPLTVSGLSTVLPAAVFQRNVLEAPPVPTGPIPVVAPNVFARRVLWEEPSAASVRFTAPAPYANGGAPVSYPTYEALLAQVYDNEVFGPPPATPTTSYPDAIFLLPFYRPYYTAKLGTQRLVLISEAACETTLGTTLRSFDVVTSEPH